MSGPWDKTVRHRLGKRPPSTGTAAPGLLRGTAWPETFSASGAVDRTTSGPSAKRASFSITTDQIRALLIERRPVQLRPDELLLYKLAFRRMTPAGSALAAADAAADAAVDVGGHGA